MSPSNIEEEATSCLDLSIIVSLDDQDVLWWARGRRSRAGDAAGWSANLICCLGARCRRVVASLAAFWRIAPGALGDARLATWQWRTMQGTLFSQPGKPKPRPIAAPSLCRRVVVSHLSRACRGVVWRFCASRGYVGHGHGAELDAYSAFPLHAVAMGLTFCCHDRSNSQNTLGRAPMLRGLRDAAGGADARDRHNDPAGYRRLVELAALCVFDSAALPRNVVNIRDGPRGVRLNALSQGCASAGPMSGACAGCWEPACRLHPVRRCPPRRAR